MFELPLHPKLVHLPLGLAVLLPLLLVGLLVAIRRAWLPERAWWAGAGLPLLLVGGAWAAAETGEGDEERVEAFVAKQDIEAHEEAAESLIALSALTAMLALAGARGPQRLRGAAQVLTVVAALGALGLAVRTGALGGALVYEHGAARAWTAPARDAPQAAPHLRARETGD